MIFLAYALCWAASVAGAAFLATHDHPGIAITMLILPTFFNFSRKRT